MASSDAIQTLISALSFGIALATAAGALLVFSRGHGSSTFKDGRRLALVLFLLFSALWTIIDFINLLIPTSSAGTCQTGLIFTTALDQLARVAAEQFVLWSITHGAKMTAVRIILQGVLVIRLIAGAVFVGITRPDFAPTCVARTSILPVAIVVLVLDAVIILMLLSQASSLGMVEDRREDHQSQKRALLFIVAGLAVWTGTSIPMLLGITTFVLLLKTLLPAIGLLIFIGIVTSFNRALMSQNGVDPRTADARSPFASPLPQPREVMQTDIGVDGSMKPIYPKFSESEIGKPDIRNPSVEGKSGPGYRVPGGVFPSIFAASSSAANVTEQPVDVSRQSKLKQKSVRGLAISGPTMNEVDSSTIAFSKIATIDLETAVSNDRQRRATAGKKSPFSTPRAVPTRPAMSPEDLRKKDAGITRKQTQKHENSKNPTIGLSTSTSLSPGREEVRRRSPRGMKGSGASDDIYLRSTTTGLSSNLRTGRDILPPKTAIPQQQTVMLMNDIIYDDPEMVQAIMSSRTPKIHQLIFEAFEKSPQVSYDTDLKSSRSIIHRPRPIPRHRSRGMFKSLQSPAHQRSKSGSSIYSRNSFLPSYPGSPTELPPLPVPSVIYTAAKLGKILPNDTKSMTFDEKVQLMFPAPPKQANKRRSSVPSLRELSELSNLYDNSAKTTIEPEPQAFASPALSTSAAVPNTKQGPDGEVEEWKHETYKSDTTLVHSHNSADTNILQVALGDMAILSNQQDKRDTTTPGVYTDRISPSNFSEAHALFVEDAIPESPLKGLGDEGEGDSGEMIPFIMDLGEHRQSMIESSIENRQSNASDATSPKAWHCRIGDELPTFSGRKSIGESRRSSPPTPLQLMTRRGMSSPIIVRKSQPSPLLDSPAKALQEIQVQLSRLEEAPKRESIGEILRQMPDSVDDFSGLIKDDGMERLRLLENLEKEMGQQETEWHQMQDHIRRDSMSSLASPQSLTAVLSPEGMKYGFLKDSPAFQSPFHPRTVVRRPRIRDSLTTLKKQSVSMPEEVSAKNPISGWQQHLEMAQMTYEDENAAAESLRCRPSLNFLSVTITPKANTESSTPPENDLKNEPEIAEFNSPVVFQEQTRYLWQPENGLLEATKSQLWNPASASKQKNFQLSEPPAKDLRPVSRRSNNELHLNSLVLWSKSQDLSDEPEANTLWLSKSEPSRPSSTIKVRPVTQKPQRRTRRITALADIVENPEPLPNKRDTLGIFQFPWGERSDMAIPESTRTMRPPSRMSGSVLYSSLDARSRQLEPEIGEYSSFFDEYDEEDELDNEVNSDSDDEFDETTLWEIATLLQNTNIPSKNSLLPPMSASREIVDDYEEETSSGSYFDSEYEDEEDSRRESFNEGPASSSFFDLDDEDVDEADEDINDRINEEVDDDVNERIVALQIDEDADNEHIGQENQWRGTENDLEDEDVISFRAENKVAEIYDENTHESENEVEDLSDPVEYLVARVPSTRETLLWDSDKRSNTESTYGLQQPDRTTWLSYNTSSYDTVRSKSRPTAMVSDLSSHDLWALRDTRSSPIEDGIMWNTRSTTIQPVVTETQVLTWAPREKVKEVSNMGLFSLGAGRENFRSTSEIPAAIEISRVPRRATPVLPRLSSRNLWRSEGFTAQAADGWLWVARVELASPIEIISRGPTMWRPQPPITETPASGLFNKSSIRADYRRSESEPAASTLIHTPRSHATGIPKLESNKLWRPERATTANRIHDWISESSVRPTSPSVYSTTSSGRSSPDISDASSIASTSTKASSVYLQGAAAVRTLSAKKKTEDVPPPPPPVDPRHYISKIPTPSLARKSSISAKEPMPSIPTSRPKSPARPRDSLFNEPVPPPMPTNRSKSPARARDSILKKPTDAPNAPALPSSARQSRVLASRSIFETDAKPASGAKIVPKFRRSVLPSKPIEPLHRAIRHQHRPAVAFRTNWDDALNVAILAGLSRPVATSADWDLALGEAVFPSNDISLSFGREAALDDKLISENAAMSDNEPSSDDDSASDDVSVSDSELDAEDEPIFVIEPASPSTETLTEPHSAETQQNAPGLLDTVFITNIPEPYLQGVYPESPEPMVRSKILRPIASAADWDMALGKAISQGRPRLQRPTAFSFMWNDALKEAIAASTPQQSIEVSEPIIVEEVVASDEIMDLGHLAVEPKIVVVDDTTDVESDFGSEQIYDAAILHPVFFTENMVSVARETHPAATGHVWDLRFDAAVLHPVFFANKLVSTTSDVHPACIGHVSIYNPRPTKEAASLWIQQSLTPASPATKLWSKSIKPANFRARFEHVPFEHSRRPTKPSNKMLADLESFELWHSYPADSIPRDWLRSSSQSPTGIFPLFRKPSIRRSSRESMWTPSSFWGPSSIPDSTPDIFANIRYEPTKRVSTIRASVLSHLSSTELYKAAVEEKEEVDWLRVSVAAPSLVSAPTPMASMLWKQEVVTIPDFRASVMWVPESASVPDRFANLRLEPTKRHSTTRLSVLPRVQSTQLYKVLDKKKTGVNWLQASSALTPSRSFMWAASASMPDLFGNMKHEYVRRLSTRPSTLPRLQSTELYKATIEEKTEINWLKASSVIPQPKSPMMWATSGSKPDLFENVKAEHVRRVSARPAALARLQSTELFHGMSVEKIEVDWLQASTVASTSIASVEPITLAPTEVDFATQEPALEDSEIEETMIDVLLAELSTEIQIGTEETAFEESKTEELYSEEVLIGEPVTEVSIYIQMPIEEPVIQEMSTEENLIEESDSEASIETQIAALGLAFEELNTERSDIEEITIDGPVAEASDFQIATERPVYEEVPVEETMIETSAAEL